MRAVEVPSSCRRFRLPPHPKEEPVQPDLYTKAVLTVIALCLVVLAWGSLEETLAPNANAQVLAGGAELKGDTISCRIPGNGYKRCLPVIVGQ